MVFFVSLSLENLKEYQTNANEYNIIKVYLKVQLSEKFTKFTLDSQAKKEGRI